MSGMLRRSTANFKRPPLAKLLIRRRRRHHLPGRSAHSNPASPIRRCYVTNRNGLEVAQPVETPSSAPRKKPVKSGGYCKRQSDHGRPFHARQGRRNRRGVPARLPARRAPIHSCQGPPERCAPVPFCRRALHGSAIPPTGLPPHGKRQEMARTTRCSRRWMTNSISSSPGGRTLETTRRIPRPHCPIL
jgi:hypothetical protein